MKVHFQPNNYTPSGIVSFLSYSNEDFQKAIRQAFHESPREYISEIIIEHDGIKAVFELKNTGTK